MSTDQPIGAQRCTPDRLRRHAREILRAAEHRPTDAEALQWRADASILDAEADRLSHPAPQDTPAQTLPLAGGGQGGGRKPTPTAATEE